MCCMKNTQGDVATQTGLTRTKHEQDRSAVPEAVKYCLYARKSSESAERQVLSIDSQTKEMLQIAERDGLNVVEIKRESHSAKATGERPVFNELLKDVREGKFNGILTWAPDRLSRNAGDLGAVVDLIDQGLLVEIRTHGQSFSNNPNEKYLLMILGSTAKLENDHRGENVKRGLRTRVEMGFWPGMAPIGYSDQNLMDKKGQKLLDPVRAPIVKQMFEKVAYEKWSGRKLYNWLKHDMNFKTRGNKTLTLSGIYRIFENPFYHGRFEFPRNSGNWYEGKHKPIITKELFDQAHIQLKRDQIVRENKEFAFTKLFTCGQCGSGVSAEEKYKQRKDGGHTRYVYYGCTRSRDRNCTNPYIREEELITELLKIIDQIDINELGLKVKLEEEIKRFSRFERMFRGGTSVPEGTTEEMDVRAYMKYLLREGSMSEKRDLLGNLRSRLIYSNKTICLSNGDDSSRLSP
ncbi:recombinase family protein [Patescibacteria group bacterium]|nr:MAG: recombinase family protein [Patescibacteria group bacterium]